MTGGTGATSAGRPAFAAFARTFLDRPGVSEGTMLHSPGLRVDGRFFAFVGSDDRLVVKVPRDRAVELVADGTAEVVTLGTRTLREWVSLDGDGPSAAETWRATLEEAYAYVGGR